MRSVLKFAVSAFFLTILCGNFPVHASTIPEKLDFELTWAGINIGTSHITTAMNGEFLEIVSKVDSAKWTHPFYKVDDLETTKLRRTGKGGSYVFHNYKLNLLEGKNRIYRAVTADRTTKKFRYVDLVGFSKWYRNLVEPVWDPVSSLYAVRQQPLAVGKPVYVNVVDRSGAKRIRVNVLRKETVTTPAGTFRTVVISPEMAIDSEGLFYARGPLTIWLTDDVKKVPVIIEKRINDLFRQGVPNYLQRIMPAGVKNNIPKMETIRALLVGGNY